MREQHPEKYAKTLTLKVSEEEHQKLKMLAVGKKKTLKEIIFEALSKAFPDWKEK